MHNVHVAGRDSCWRCILLTGALFSLIAGSAGCISSSVRFTRESTAALQPGARKVPSGYDYRKTYAIPCEKLVRVAKSYLGIRYRYGAMSRSRTDCSGLVCMIYFDVAKAKLPHSSRQQRKIGNLVPLKQAKCGDLVFFRGGLFGAVNHVGIYIDNKKFIHASTRRGVMFNHLDEEYYKKRFVEVRRIFK